MLAAAYFTVIELPVEVNAAAYLAGAGQTAVFVPVVNEGTHCGRGGCHSSTGGYLQGSGVLATWPAVVPLGRPFPVRTVVWHALGSENMDGGGYAVTRLLLWLMITLFDLFFITVGISAFRRQRTIALR